MSTVTDPSKPERGVLDVATEPVTDEIVANAAGISRSTLHNYLDRHPSLRAVD